MEDINTRLITQGAALGVEVTPFQSNHEGAIIDYLHSIRTTHGAVVINPGGLTHTSVALRDALSGISLPVFEVHISNVHAREPFRHHSYVSAIAVGVICGLGSVGYDFALQAAVTKIAAGKKS
jgi:3-dehydroquinate dehydratase-2